MTSQQRVWIMNKCQLSEDSSQGSDLALSVFKMKEPKLWTESFYAASSFMVFRKPGSPPSFGLTKQPEHRGMAAVHLSGLTIRYLCCGWEGSKETNDTSTYKEFGSNKLTPSRYLSAIGPIWCLEFPVNRLMRFGVNSWQRGGTCILSRTPGRKWSPAEPDGNPWDTRPAISRGGITGWGPATIHLAFIVLFIRYWRWNPALALDGVLGLHMARGGGHLVREEDLRLPNEAT